MNQTVREAHVLISEMSVVLIFNLIFCLNLCLTFDELSILSPGFESLRCFPNFYLDMYHGYIHKKS